MVCQLANGHFDRSFFLSIVYSLRVDISEKRGPKKNFQTLNDYKSLIDQIIYLFLVWIKSINSTFFFYFLWLINNLTFQTSIDGSIYGKFFFFFFHAWSKVDQSAGKKSTLWKKSQLQIQHTHTHRHIDDHGYYQVTIEYFDQYLITFHFCTSWQ